MSQSVKKFKEIPNPSPESFFLMNLISSSKKSFLYEIFIPENVQKKQGQICPWPLCI
jgi:hypothetical protein